MYVIYLILTVVDWNCNSPFSHVLFYRIRYIFEKNIIRWFANSIFHSSKYWKNRVSLCIDWKVFANNGLWHKRGEQLWLSFYEIIYLSPNDTTHPPMSGLIIHNHPNFTNRTWFWNAYSFIFQHVSVFPMTSFR